MIYSVFFFQPLLNKPSTLFFTKYANKQMTYNTYTFQLSKNLIAYNIHNIMTLRRLAYAEKKKT